MARLGFGTVSLAGPQGWGEPRDHYQSIVLLRRVVDSGITLLETADSYGPEVSERLIAQALYPYPRDLVIATKGGLVRSGPDAWKVCGRPAHLRTACEGSLRRLKLERIDLYQLDCLDPAVPIADQVGALGELQQEGKVRHVGLSEVGIGQLEAARGIVSIATIQNRYNLVERECEPMLEYCEREGLGFLARSAITGGALAGSVGKLAEVAGRLGTTPAQVELAWLLQRSPVLLPLAGTSKVAHLRDNVSASFVRLDEAALLELGSWEPRIERQRGEDRCS